MTRQVELVGGSLDELQVTVADGMNSYQYFKSGFLDQLRRKPVIRIETYSERSNGKFYHILTEKRDA